MKLRTAKKQAWIKKTNGDEEAEFLVDLLTPRETLQILDEVKAMPKRMNEGDGELVYRAKIKRIDKVIIDWRGLEDEAGNSIECTPKNKEIIYNFNKALIDEILDEAEELADIRNQEEEATAKNSEIGLNGSLSPA